MGRGLGRREAEAVRLQMDEDLDRAQEVLAEAEALRQDHQALQARLARAQRQIETEQR